MSTMKHRKAAHRAETSATPRRHGHAVVLGASMGGLLVARVLADTFDQVTVLDKDELPEIGAHRRFVPQSRHLHALLSGGRQVLEELLPGLTADLVAYGAMTTDVGQTARIHLGAGRIARHRIGVDSLLVSRPLLEGQVRRRVGGDRRIEIFDRVTVHGLIASDDRRTVTGVRFRRSGVDGPTETMSADLVVDASGRASQSPAWLEELGYERVPEDKVKVGIGYASRTFRRRPGDLDGDLVVLIGADPQHPRVSALGAIEGDRWHVSLGGYEGDHPPTDPAGWLAFAESLHAPDVAELVRGAEPLDDPVGFLYPASIRRRYERMRRFPERYVVFGDALCSFNPIYGQGMSVASLESQVLRRCVAQRLDGVGARFFREVRPVVDVPWDISAGSDLRFAQVEGRRTARTRLLNSYLDRYTAAATSDADLARQFSRVLHLVDRPESLMAPRRMLHVARGWRAARSSSPAAVAEELAV